MCERCMGGYDRERRLEAIRKDRDAKFEVVAVYGTRNTTVTGASLAEVAAVLIAKGYVMATAQAVNEGDAIRVLHEDDSRKPAVIKKVLRAGMTL